MLKITLILARLNYTKYHAISHIRAIGHNGDHIILESYGVGLFVQNLRDFNQPLFVDHS